MFKLIVSVPPYYARIYHVAMSHHIMDRGKPAKEQVETNLKLINNSSSLNKGNHNCDGVWISDPS